MVDKGVVALFDCLTTPLSGVKRKLDEMWADISAKADALGEAGADYKSWVDWVEKTGGDDPKKAGQLILKLVSDESAAVNGRFCWIDSPLQEPIPSWNDPTDERPWI